MGVHWGSVCSSPEVRKGWLFQNLVTKRPLVARAQGSTRKRKRKVECIVETLEKRGGKKRTVRGGGDPI